MVDTDPDELTNIPRKLSYISATGEDQTNAAGKMGVMTIDPLKTSSTDVEKTPPNDGIPQFSVAKIYKNLILLSVAFVLMFTAYNGMTMLQSSLNTKNNVGINSLIVTYSFLIVS